jgi:hypothetical protein
MKKSLKYLQKTRGQVPPISPRVANDSCLAAADGVACSLLELMYENHDSTNFIKRIFCQPLQLAFLIERHTFFAT